MLSTSESKGLRQILKDIDDEELFAVLDTVTKRMFKTRLRSEAIDKILTCTMKPSELLRRQKITKKILFNYLVKEGTVVLAEWGKPALVKKCLELWGSTESCNESDFVEVENEKKPCDLTEVTAQMGVEFSKWFFRILNKLDGFGPQHFWSNCNLTAELYTPSDQKDVSMSGDKNVADFLASLILIDKFYFHANESKDSVMLEAEQHGLIRIVIRGILHQNSSCVGLFDSAFGLVKHPDYQHTYKIQMIQLKMQGADDDSEVEHKLKASNYSPDTKSI